MREWISYWFRNFLVVAAICFAAWGIGLIVYHAIANSSYRCFDTSNTPPQPLPEDSGVNIIN